MRRLLSRIQRILGLGLAGVGFNRRRVLLRVHRTLASCGSEVGPVRPGGRCG